MPTDELDTIIRLQKIFMPYASKQQDKLYKPDGQEPKAFVPFVHYTSAEAAFKIIKSKRLWMRNAVGMSDYKEVVHGQEILSRYFSDETRYNKFTSSLDPVAPNVAKEAIDLFNRHIDNIRFDTYISSLSEHDTEKEDKNGRLSMWRAFGNSSARVALVLNIPSNSNGGQTLNVIFSPVAYLAEDEIHKVIDEIITNIQSNQDFLRSLSPGAIKTIVFNTFLAAVTCLKHEGFKEEKEWRAIYCPSIRTSPYMNASIEIVNGVPQIVYNIPMNSQAHPTLADLDFSRIFSRLIIGPSPSPYVMHGAFVEALKGAGVDKPEYKVFPSGIPIRT
jgi:hypothetical protein